MKPMKPVRQPLEKYFGLRLFSVTNQVPCSLELMDVADVPGHVKLAVIKQLVRFGTSDVGYVICCNHFTR